MTVSEIKQFMKEHKITQRELSERSGISLATLNDIFRGRTLNPRLDTINAMLNALGLPLELPVQPTTLTDFESSLANKNTVIIYDGTGDKRVYKFDKTKIDEITAICEVLNKGLK